MIYEAGATSAVLVAGVYEPGGVGRRPAYVFGDARGTFEHVCYASLGLAR